MAKIKLVVCAYHTGSLSHGIQDTLMCPGNSSTQEVKTGESGDQGHIGYSRPAWVSLRPCLKNK